MICGGLGFVIGTIVFFSWYKSEVQWKKVIAYICAVWMTISVLIYFVAMGAS